MIAVANHISRPVCTQSTDPMTGDPVSKRGQHCETTLIADHVGPAQSQPPGHARLVEEATRIVRSHGDLLASSSAGVLLLTKLLEVPTLLKSSRTVPHSTRNTERLPFDRKTLGLCLERLKQECPDYLNGYAEVGVSPELILDISCGDVPSHIKFICKLNGTIGTIHTRTQRIEIDVNPPTPSTTIRGLNEDGSLHPAFEILSHENIHAKQMELCDPGLTGRNTLLFTSVSQLVKAGGLVGVVASCVTNGEWAFSVVTGACGAGIAWLRAAAVAMFVNDSRVVLAMESHAFVGEKMLRLPSRIIETLNAFDYSRGQRPDHVLLDFDGLVKSLKPYAANFGRSDSEISTVLQAVLTCTLLGMSHAEIGKATVSGHYSRKTDRHSTLSPLAEGALAAFGLTPEDPRIPDILSAAAICKAAEAAKTLQAIRRSISDVVTPTHS